MGRIDQGTAVISWPAQETMTPFNDEYCIQTNIHCPKCGFRMWTNHKGLTELSLVCRGCGLLAKWTGSQEIDFLTWNAGEVDP